MAILAQHYRAARYDAVLSDAVDSIEIYRQIHFGVTKHRISAISDQK